MNVALSCERLLLVGLSQSLLIMTQIPSKCGEVNPGLIGGDQEIGLSDCSILCKNQAVYIKFGWQSRKAAELVPRRFVSFNCFSLCS